MSIVISRVAAGISLALRAWPAGLCCVLLLALPAAYAQQICTTTTIGNDEFWGIDGSSDTNVIAVGKDGGIARFDGSTWTSTTSPTGEDLRDVHVISTTQAFAVGKKGEILQLSGASWSQHPGVTNEELRGVWAASSSEVWVVGKKGTIFSYDGAVWTDESAAAGTSNKDLEDAWGDGTSFFGLDDQGTLFRYDRGAGAWDLPDTLCAVGGGFEDLWGDAGGNLYLVRRKQVYLHNGSSCTVIANSSEDLRGVSGTDVTGEIYGAGKKGAVMYHEGLTWQESQQGGEDLRDVWVSASGNPYYAGKKGEVTVCQWIVPDVVGDWHFDDCTLDLPGSTVTDSSANGLDGVTVGGAALQTDGQLCPALSLDGSSAYASVPDTALLDLNLGMGLAVWVRHSGGSLDDWQAILAKGDSAYRLHLNGGCTIADLLPGNTTHGLTFGLNGGCAGAELNSNVVPAPGVWYHVAGSYDGSRMRIYINGTLVNTADYSAAIGTNNFDLFIGDNPENPGRNWDGDIDELTIWDAAISRADVESHMNRTRPCINCSVAEFVVSHDNAGIHCLNESIQIDVIDSLSGTPRLDYDTQITLDTQTGAGTWSLVSGGGTLTDAVGGDGLATYDWPLNESSAVFALDYPAGPPSMDVDAFETLDTTIRDQDGEGNLVFTASGFTLTGVPLANPPPATITPFGGPRIAGTDMELYLTAFGQTPTDPQCGVIETYTGAKNLKFWSTYLDPGTGTLQVSIDGVAAAAAEAAATAQPLTFINGQVKVNAKYKDAGQIQILVKDDTLAHPDLPNGIRGATLSFVSRPDRFELSAIEDSGGNPNPAAADASGPVFIAAGQPFTVTVTALDAEGDPTPNYGRESVPESVALASTLVAPAAGNNPPLSPALGFGAFSGGAATGSSFVWPEVGVITLTPSVGDGAYLTAGNVSGPASTNVGRFVPDHFTASLNVAAFTTSCASGGFTYLGESFDYGIAPQITLTAQSALATVTQNYTASFFKINNTSVVNRAYTAAAGSLDLSGLPAATSDPAIVDLGGGTASLTFSAGTGLAFNRGAPAAPFDADIELSIDVLDTDAVAAASNPVTFGAAGGIAFTAGSAMRYGRVMLANALGSELVNLALPLATQFYVDAATGFAPHVADDCTAAIPLTLGTFAGDLAPGETCARDTGNPGVSGAGCAVAAPPTERYRAPPLAGDFNLFLAAPGAGNGGSVTVTGDAPTWLEFDWNAVLPGLEDPTGTATFGIFSGNARRIYLREVY